MIKINWDGIGLPPIGITCMIDPHSNHHEFYSRHAGKEVLIVAHDIKDDGTKLAIYRVIDDEGFNEYHGLTSDTGNFIPICTHEQIMAKERAKSIDEIYQMISSQMGHLNVRELAIEIYEAGFRKQGEQP